MLKDTSFLDLAAYQRGVQVPLLGKYLWDTFFFTHSSFEGMPVNGIPLVSWQ